ncbi:hypothetical protein W822_20085 [Advenella kashmirensis W13003]|uniref:Uncharacterized protein n=1 Tax=Advenella kashmirensis W13003 TaxID=1424334 RepID=V8QNM8_9BURK|nr:hypothetical protein [Advenella kashmirensis]ETF00943.1 hypothetical protein W822_20085 [Advenella kashmirensis W13003]
MMKTLTADKTEELMELAACMAHETFEKPVPEHTTGIYERLVFGYWHAECPSRAATLH